MAEPRTREIYLASACDDIVMDPAGGLFLGGLAQTTTFFKTAMDRLGVQVDLARIAQYKGAMEPFTMSELSAPVKANEENLLDEDFRHLLTGMAHDRASHGLDVAQLRHLVDQAVFSPEEARGARLVDQVVDESELEKMLPALIGKAWPVREATEATPASERWVPARVAVVIVDGTIMEGDGSELPFSVSPMAWSGPIVDAIEEAGKDASIGAVVLRVNSPGGSALASDRIARALVRLRGSGKPLLVSMGDVAASGGYYVSAPANDIFASPSTLTGSIGIFAYKVDVAGLLARLGVFAETLKRGPHADLYSTTRPWTEDERGLMMKELTRQYQRFLATVVEGRSHRGTPGMTLARADELGRGRVWSGAQAAGNGLVDRLGGFVPALEEAARRGGIPLGPGGLPDLVTWPRPRPTPLLRTLANLPGGRAIERLVLPVLAEGGTSLQARLPFDVETR